MEQEKQPEKRLITIREASERLNLSYGSVEYLVRCGKLETAVKGKVGKAPGRLTMLYSWVVEEYRHQTSYQRYRAARERNNVERVYCDISQAESPVLPTRAAAKFLGINPASLIRRAQKGDIITYRENRKRVPCYYAIDELRTLGQLMAAYRNRPTTPRKPVRRKRVENYAVQWGLIEQEDLQPDEWPVHIDMPLNCRQAAWLLRTSITEVNKLRRRGRLRGTWMANLNGFGPARYYYDAEDILRLRTSEDYDTRREQSRAGNRASRHKSWLIAEGYEVPRRLAK